MSHRVGDEEFLRFVVPGDRLRTEETGTVTVVVVPHETDRADGPTIRVEDLDTIVAAVLGDEPGPVGGDRHVGGVDELPRALPVFAEGLEQFALGREDRDLVLVGVRHHDPTVRGDGDPRGFSILRTRHRPRTLEPPVEIEPLDPRRLVHHVDASTFRVETDRPRVVESSIDVSSPPEHRVRRHRFDPGLVAGPGTTEEQDRQQGDQR